MAWAGAQSALLIYLAVAGLLRMARLRKARSIGERTLFEASTFLRAILLVSGAGFLLVSIYLSFVTQDPWTALLFAGGAAAALVGYPTVIVTPSQGVSAHGGFRVVELPWAEVQSIEFHRGPSSTVVIGGTGKRVVHTGYHSAPSAFRRTCEAISHRRIVETVL